MMNPSCRVLLLLLLVASATNTCNLSQLHAREQSVDGMRVHINARDLSRKLLTAELEIDVPAKRRDHSIALWYPKWVPGSHGPGGPIANVVGLQVRDQGGELLAWKRTAGEVYRIEVQVPANQRSIRLSVRYATNQPTTNSFGHDCFASESIGIISPSCLLFYLEGVDIDVQKIQASLELPNDWHAATALPTKSQRTSKSEPIEFRPVNLRTFVDSPIMIGEHYREYQLCPASPQCPPHWLHVFADNASSTTLNPAIVDGYRSMVEQAARLIGSHPFNRFDLLLAVTNNLPKNGLEHSRSSLNVLPPHALQSPATLKGWDRLLVPHEYLHAWCGKYRRPSGMLTSDFHTAKDTELLWVYEGLTQYLGELVEARSGLMDPAEFRNRLAVELRNATHQQGRQWRPLVDTAAASHILRDPSPSWGGLRRSQDYYMEGMLFWLEADAKIRELTDGQKSLDDFCHRFFHADGVADKPKAYTRREVVKDLQTVVKFDWDGLIDRRIESFQQEFDPSVAQLLGYQFELTGERPSIPANTFRYNGGDVDLLDSLGTTIAPNGEVERILLGSPADRARLTPGMKILAIGQFAWSRDRMLEAVATSTNFNPIELVVASGERVATVQVQYYDGSRYWNLVRDRSQPDLLGKIVEPK